MVLLDKLLGLFYRRAAVVNDDKGTLQKEVNILQKKYGKWIKVSGYSNYRQLFLALHLAKLKEQPFTAAFIRDNEPIEGELILKKEEPDIKIYKYSDTQKLIINLPSLR